MMLAEVFVNLLKYGAAAAVTIASLVAYLRANQAAMSD
jgi:hypothetical protein